MQIERRGDAERDSFDRKAMQGRMINAYVDVQELGRRIFRKADAEKTWRFLRLHVHVTKAENLRAAYREAKANEGESIEAIKAQAVQKFFPAIQEEIVAGIDRPSKNRWVEIPMGDSKTRKPGPSTIRDRVIEGTLKLICKERSSAPGGVRHQDDGPLARQS